MSAQTKKTTKSLNINLLPDEDFGRTSFGKFLKWALSTGRYIVVFTEFIVLILFFSRFKLDADKANLDELIDQKKQVLVSTADLEKEIRNLQDSIEKVRAIEDLQTPYSSLITSFTQMVPNEVMVDSFSLKGGTLSLACTSQSTQGLGIFIYQLKTSPKFTNVSVDNISRKSSEPVKFNLTLTLSKVAFNENTK